MVLLQIVIYYVKIAIATIIYCVNIKMTILAHNQILWLFRNKWLEKGSPEKKLWNPAGMLIQPRKKSSSRRAEHACEKALLWIYFKWKMIRARWKQIQPKKISGGSNNFFLHGLQYHMIYDIFINWKLPKVGNKMPCELLSKNWNNLLHIF